MSLKDFAELVGADYEMLRNRAKHGYNVFKPLPTAHVEPQMPQRKEPTLTGRYTMEELAELYRHFRGAEDELDILADLSCLKRRSKAVRLLRKQLQEEIEKKYREAQGK